ncbi:MAG: hypothetical protein ACJAUG_000320 [Halioglobus sp.]
MPGGRKVLISQRLHSDGNQFELSRVGHCHSPLSITRLQ